MKIIINNITYLVVLDFQNGGGTQYVLPEIIRQLLESGAISPF